MGSCKRLYYLPDAAHLTKTKNSFGIGKIAASCIVKNFTEMIFQHLGLEFIKLHLSEKEFEQLKYYFERVHGFP